MSNPVVLTEEERNQLADLMLRYSSVCTTKDHLSNARHIGDWINSLLSSRVADAVAGEREAAAKIADMGGLTNCATLIRSRTTEGK